MTPKHLAILCGMIYNVVVVVGTAYIVFGLGHSGWWWLLAAGLLASVKTS